MARVQMRRTRQRAWSAGNIGASSHAHDFKRQNVQMDAKIQFQLSYLEYHNNLQIGNKTKNLFFMSFPFFPFYVNVCECANVNGPY